MFALAAAARGYPALIRRSGAAYGTMPENIMLGLATVRSWACASVWMRLAKVSPLYMYSTKRKGSAGKYVSEMGP